MLNGGGNVAPRTRKRVREVVDRLGDCAPEPRRRQQLPGTRPPVFVRCPYLLTDYFATSIAETPAQHGQAMVLEAGDAVVCCDRALLAEVLVLRQENAVLRRQIARVRYEPADRAWFAALSALIPRARWAEIFPVTPATLLG